MKVPTFSGDALVLMSVNPVTTFPTPLRRATHAELSMPNGSVRNSGAAGRNGDAAYVALELGERFLPRPTTTFTKRRLYCEGGKRGDEERQPKKLNPKKTVVARRRRAGGRAYLEALDGATLGELLLVLFGDLRSLTAHL